MRAVLSFPACLAWIAVLCLGSTAAQTTSEPVPSGPPLSASDESLVQHRLEYLTRRLELAPDQQNRIWRVLSDEAAKISVSFNRVSLTKDDREAGRLRGEAKEKISAVLNPDQREAYSRMKCGKDWLP